MLTILEEHYGYISDPLRLELFSQAISHVIQSGDLVADVGCGFGILGLMCLQSGCSHVWGVDRTDAIEIARETMTRAGLGDHYTCIRGHSFRITLPKPVDVVVCDHVGYFGLDYGIVATMGDARRRLLKPGGRIIPGVIRLMLAGAISPECRKKAEAWADSAVPPEYRWLREYGVNSEHAQKLEREEIATEPIALGTVDLNEDSPDLITFSATFVAIRDGVLDGLAGWFECELAEGVWMTNSPLSEVAIDRPQAFFPFDEPIEVAADDRIEVSLSIRHDTGLISWTARNVRTGKRQKQSNWCSTILSDADLVAKDAKALVLSAEGLARRIVIGYVDGKRSATEIEQAVLRDHPDLLPTAAEISRFVRSEIGRSAR